MAFLFETYFSCLMAFVTAASLHLCPSKCRCLEKYSSLSIMCNSSHYDGDKVRDYLLSAKYIVTKLTVTGSSMRAIPPEICILEDVDYFYLDHNAIGDLIKGEEHWSCARRVINASLTYNKIKRIESDYFYNFISLEHLLLSHNDIRYIDPKTFTWDTLKCLKYLDLSHNKLIAADMWVFRLPNFVKFSHTSTVIDMNYNEIKEFTNSVHFHISELNNTQSYLEIHLWYNQLTSLTKVISLMGIKSVNDLLNFLYLRFYISHNPYSCDCDMYTFVSLVQPFIPFYLNDPDLKQLVSATCASPPALAGRRIATLPFQNYQCNITNCPVSENCSCIYTSKNETLRISCENAQLTHLPTNLTMRDDTGHKLISSVKNLELYLASNNITELKTTDYLPKVRILDLSNNKIREWMITTLDNMQQISILLLHNNQLGYLPKGLDNWKAAELREISLGGNPFYCNCESRWMKAWISGKKPIIKDLNRIRCSSPAWNKGEMPLNVSDTDFVCNRLPVLAIAVSSSLLGLTALTVAVILYCFRRYVHLLVFTHCGWKFGPNKHWQKKEFDVFISYCSMDEDRVKDIAEYLEAHSPAYNVAIFYRDFEPGTAIAENIIKCIECSRCTLMIVSQNFVQSEWCKYEFRAAHFETLKEKISKLLVVLLEPVPDQNLEPDLRLYLKTNIYLDRNDSRFYSKLLMSLPSPSGTRNPISL